MVYQIKISQKKGDLHIKYGNDRYIMGYNKNLYPHNSGDSNKDNTKLPGSEGSRILDMCLVEILKKPKEKRSKAERTLVDITHNNN